MVFLNKHSVAQILILLVISVIFQIMIVISNPMTDKWDRRATWIIELSVSIYLYVLILLTDFMGENMLREELGWVLTIIIGCIVAINVSIFFWKSFWRALDYIKEKFQQLIV
jgi:Na+/melibiose symporter-like transporter